LGTPTGSSESGSVEEIKTHLASGKPAMIYFSSQPVRLDSVDAAQYEAVKKFQEWCQQSGLYKTYDDPGDFQKTFRKDLQINLYQVPYLTNLLKKAGAFDSDAVYKPKVMIEISIEARELLRTAAADKHGTILKAHYIGGSHIQAHGQVFGQGGDRRAYARWEAALEELEHEGLDAPLGHKREIFAVTDKGYKLGDQLWGGSPSTAQH